MKNDIILSVSIAAYNVEKYIDRALQSFNDVFFENKVEVFIISDGSTDNTDLIAQRYVNEFPNIFKLIKKENGGWGSTINLGMSIARGKYFKQLDGDDYFDKENTKKFVLFLEKCEEDMVLSPFARFDDITGDIIEVQNFSDNIRKITFPVDIEDLLKIYNNIFMHAICVKTSVLIEHKLQVEEKCFYTDAEFAVKVYAYSATVNFFDKIVYMYRIGRGGQSVSSAGFAKHYKEHQRVIFKLIGFCESYKGNVVVKDAMMNRICEMILAQYNIYLVVPNEKKYIMELKKYDSTLKKISPILYRKTNCENKIILMRKTGFITYGLVRFLLEHVFKNIIIFDE